LPPTVFVKRNLERFSFPTEMYANEVRIYRDVLPGSGLEAPAVFALETAPDDDACFVIVMEDLSERPGARLGHVLEPVTPDDVDGLLETLSRLHATWWDSPGLSRLLPWAKEPRRDPAMTFWSEVGPRLTRNHLQRGHRAHLVDQRRWNPDLLFEAFRRMVEACSGGPLTLLHGDVHAGNVYYVKGGPGGLLDWQLSLRGNWALDVTYLLTTALTPADREANEQALLAGYLGRLRARGIAPPSDDEAWLRYRQHALYGVMMWLITPQGVHTDEAQGEFLRRCLAAADDLGTLDALRKD
jgi:hypothetical protein